MGKTTSRSNYLEDKATERYEIGGALVSDKNRRRKEKHVEGQKTFHSGGRSTTGNTITCEDEYISVRGHCTIK